MLRATLPDHLGSAFTVAAARAAGVPPSRMRAADLTRPFHGIRAREEPGASDDVADVFRASAERCVRRARQYAVGMEATRFFTHLTAAVIWELPLPAWVFLPDSDGVVASDLLDVGVFRPLRTPRAAGIRGHQVPRTHASVRRHRGLLVTSPASTFAMLAAVLGDHRDLVAIGDAIVREPMFVRDRPPISTLDELAASMTAGRRHGIERLRVALPRVRTRSASRKESLLRLLLVDAGLPEPLLNLDAVDEDGRFLACVDLAYPSHRVAIEYEGDHHRSDARQWAKDMERHERLVEAGWIVVRVSAAQLASRPAEVVARVQRALARRA